MLNYVELLFMQKELDLIFTVKSYWHAFLYVICIKTIMVHILYTKKSMNKADGSSRNRNRIWIMLGLCLFVYLMYVDDINVYVCNC